MWHTSHGSTCILPPSLTSASSVSVPVSMFQFSAQPTAEPSSGRILGPPDACAPLDAAHRQNRGQHAGHGQFRAQPRHGTARRPLAHLCPRRGAPTAFLQCGSEGGCTEDGGTEGEVPGPGWTPKLLCHRRQCECQPRRRWHRDQSSTMRDIRHRRGMPAAPPKAPCTQMDGAPWLRQRGAECQAE